MKLKDDSQQIREKLDEITEAIKGVQFRYDLALKKLERSESGLFANNDKLRVRNWEFNHQKQTLNLLKEYWNIVNQMNAKK